MDRGLSMPGKLFKTAAVQDNATKEFFVPCTGISGGGSMAYYGYYPVGRLAAISECAYTGFRIPHDYNSIVSASIVVIPRATQGAANWNLGSKYAQTGEGYQTHSENDTASTYNVTNDQVFEVNIANILTSLAANDVVGIVLSLADSAHDVDVLGVRFKYL
jgi:hypothetical protein